MGCNRRWSGCGADNGGSGTPDRPCTAQFPACCPQQAALEIYCHRSLQCRLCWRRWWVCASKMASDDQGDGIEMGGWAASATWLPLQAFLRQRAPNLPCLLVSCCSVNWRHSSEPAEAFQASRGSPAAAAAARRPRAAGTSAHGQASIAPLQSLAGSGACRSCLASRGARLRKPTLGRAGQEARTQLWLSFQCQ